MEIKLVGVSRIVDSIGRIVIPSSIRKKCDIHEGDEVELFTTTTGDIVIRKKDTKED